MKIKDTSTISTLIVVPTAYTVQITKSQKIGDLTCDFNVMKDYAEYQRIIIPIAKSTGLLVIINHYSLFITVALIFGHI